MYSAGAIEMVGGVLVMIGLFTRPQHLSAVAPWLRPTGWLMA